MSKMFQSKNMHSAEKNVPSLSYKVYPNPNL